MLELPEARRSRPLAQRAPAADNKDGTVDGVVGIWAAATVALAVMALVFWVISTRIFAARPHELDAHLP